MKRALLLAIVASACGPRSARPAGGDAWAQSGIDWTKPPAVAPTAFAPPAVSETTLGGVRVVVITNHRLPLVAIAAIETDAGGRSESAQAPGLAGLTLDVIAEAAPPHPGVRLETAIATDYASIQLVARRDDFADAAALVGGLLRAPRLADTDVVRVRDRRVAELTEHRTRLRTIAAQAFDRIVFAGHPYALPAEGTADTLVAYVRADVDAFRQRHYRPGSTTLVLCGDISIQGLVPLRQALAGWTAAEPPAAAAPGLRPVATDLAYVDVAGAEQAMVIVGRSASAAGGQTQLADDVANAILGGGEGSRLDRKLHDELGVTTGAGSSFWRGHWASSWSVAATFPTTRAAEGLTAALSVIHGAQATVTDDEVAHAKAALLRATALQFETKASTAHAFARLVGQRVAIDWYATYAQRLAAVRIEDVRVALAPGDLTIVVVGDHAKLAPDITRLTGIAGHKLTP